MVAALAEYVGKRGFLILSGRIGQVVLLDLRRRVYGHFQPLSIGFHERYTSGRMVARLTSDMDSISELVDGGIDDLVLAGLSVVSIAGILLLIDAPLALVALLSFPFLLWLSNWFRHASARAYRRTRETVALVIVHFVESLGGIRAVQAFRREPRNQEIFEAVNDDYRRANLVAHSADRDLRARRIKLIGNVTIAVVLTYGGYRALHGQIGQSVLAAFLLYLRRFFEPMQELSQFYNALQSATAALEKLSGVLQEEPAVAGAGAARGRSPPRAARGRGHVRPGGVRLPAGPDRAARARPAHPGRARRWRWSAPPARASPPSRSWSPGSTTRSSGAVRLDGVDLRELSDDDLRRGVVMVTQENFLFSGTIAENIAFGRPDATRAEIEAAAAAIGADAFIRRPARGLRHRRPQARRAALGRAAAAGRVRPGFLADPAVLILDEATSSLDIPSERLVQRALRTILADRTAFVIAHRLSTVEIADRVLVVEGGRIVEDGPPARLIAGGGRYATLHQQWADSLV